MCHICNWKDSINNIRKGVEVSIQAIHASYKKLSNYLNSINLSSLHYNFQVDNHYFQG